MSESINISANINLAGLKHEIVKKGGKHLLVIPVEDNDLYHSKQRGNVYLKIVGFPFTSKLADSPDTHMFKKAVDSEVYSKMSEEDRRRVPVLGGGHLFGPGKSKLGSNPNAINTGYSSIIDSDEEGEDLPF